MSNRRTRVFVDAAFPTREDFYKFIMSFAEQAKDFGLELKLEDVDKKKKLVSNA